MPEVHVTISPSGETKVEAKGVSGAGCSQLTKAIEAAIGSATADVKKPEFFQQSSQQSNQAAGQQAAQK